MTDSKSPANPQIGEALGWPQRALHLFTLCGFAVAQPIFDLLGRHPLFFVAHDSRPMDLVALAAIFCLLPPSVLFLLERIPGLVSERAGRSLHTVLVTFLAAAGVLPFLRLIGGVPGSLWLPAALLLGIAGAAAYDRKPLVRTGLTWFWPAPLLFAATFLFLTPVRKLVSPAPYAPAVDVEVEAETPVVVVIFDELALATLMDEDRGIDAVRFPHFAALGRRSTWFRNATTNSEITPLAVPQILTGRLAGPGPGPPTLPSVEKHPQNLFTLLAPEYRLNVFETLTSICPPELCGATRFDAHPIDRIRALLAEIPLIYLHTVLPADITRHLPDITRQWNALQQPWHVRRDKFGKMRGARKPQLFADFLAPIEAGEKRALYFLHSTLPHMRWRYLPSCRTYEAPGANLLFTPGLHKENWNWNQLSVLEGHQRYILQVQCVDRLLGDLFGALEAADLYDPALIVVTADHGVSFHPGQSRRELEDGNFQDLLPVPLFIKRPYQREGFVSDRNVENIDVLPTIVDVLGLAEPPWPMDGVSVFDPRAPERDRKQVVMKPWDGSRVATYDLADFDAKYEAVEERIRLLGRSAEPLDLYRIGPHAELIGRPLAELDPGREAEAEAELHLELPELYDDVDPESGVLPARVVGEIHHRGGGLDLAIAVDGTVWATTRTFFNHRSRSRFAATVPEHAFSRGRNTVQVFILSDGGDSPVLTPTRAAPRGFWPRMLGRWRS